MTMVKQGKVALSDVMVLRRITYEEYSRLRRNPANSHVRMTYNDGTLELVSPTYYEHESPSGRLRTLVMAVASELGIACEGAGSTTFKKSGPGPYKGKGKEPDQCFFLPNVGRILGRKRIELDEGDPPPDLWIEVDNRASSRGRLPVYAGLGVPEVWRYRARKGTLVFLRLHEGAYEPIEQSLALPMLTPALAIEALAIGDGLDEASWDRRLREWIRVRLVPRRVEDRA